MIRWQNKNRMMGADIMQKFLVVTNEMKDKDGKVTNSVRNYLESKGKECCSCKKDSDNRIIKESIPEDVDCCVMIGGDGSLIEAAKAVRFLVLTWERWDTLQKQKLTMCQLHLIKSLQVNTMKKTV